MSNKPKIVPQDSKPLPFEGAPQDPDLSTEAAIAANNFTAHVDPHLYHSSREILKKHVSSTKDRNYEVKFMGIKHPVADLAGAGKRLAQVINDTCSAFQVVGVLGHPLKFDLAVDTSNPDAVMESLFLVYLAFTPEACRVIDRLSVLDKTTPFFSLGVQPGQI